MTSYKTLLLSPLVLASLAHAPLVAANTLGSPSSNEYSSDTSLNKEKMITGSVSLQHTTPSVSATTTNGHLELSISNLSTSTHEVLLPTWSDKNGQDDIKWYSTKEIRNGSAHLRIPLKQHHSEIGIYHTHLYVKNHNEGQQFVSSIQTNVAAKQMPALQPPLLSVQNIDPLKGSYRLQVREQAYTKAIRKVEIATWSTANQSNIKWRTASFSNGNYISDINFQEHQNHSGHYQNHVYVTYTDGSRIGYTAQTVDLTQARLPIKVQTHVSRVGNIQIKLENILGSETVRYAVWSEEKGQDDLRWYEANKTGDKTYTGDIPLVAHNGTGNYQLHIYQGKLGLKSHSFQVTEQQKQGSAPTYPMGECTWGAKILAPWAGDYWGNAQDWAASARRAGFRTGTTPEVGAIAVWSGANGYGGGYGHVAVVTDVQSTHSIRVKESNYGRRRYIDDFRGWFNPVADGVTTYIYPN